MDPRLAATPGLVILSLRKEEHLSLWYYTVYSIRLYLLHSEDPA